MEMILELCLKRAVAMYLTVVEEIALSLHCLIVWMGDCKNGEAGWLLKLTYLLILKKTKVGHRFKIKVKPKE